MTVNEILALTGASRATFYRWRSRHDFPAPVAIGVFNEAQVRAWWDANQDNVGRWPQVPCITA